MSAQGTEPALVLLTLFLVAACSSLVQILFGVMRLGQLIRYMPFPVVSGYLSGVGLIIVSSQLPKLLGAPKEMNWLQALSDPSSWQPASLLIGAATAVTMLIANRHPSKVPSVIQGLAAGIAVYWLLAFSSQPALARLDDNPFVIGRFASGPEGLLDGVVATWSGLAHVQLPRWEQVLVPAATLAVLLSIDTLKTCLVLDAMSGSRHDSNRELIGQGLGNLTASLFGGTPGAGTMGPSLVNKASGGMTRLSGVFQGGWALLAFLLLTPLISWIPVAALAGLLVVIGVRMIDWHLVELARSRSTVLDFIVIIAVIVVAKTISLIAASGLGIALAILMFIREQSHSSTIRYKTRGDVTFSKRVRMLEERDALKQFGAGNAIYELQGSLFFGNTDALYSALEPEIANARHLVLDLQRVQSLDMTAAHMLERVRNQLAERGATLVLSRVPETLPSGRDLRGYLDELRVTRGSATIKMFDDFSDALEWVEDDTLREAGIHANDSHPLALADFELFNDMQPQTLQALQGCVQRRFYEAGETIFIAGTPGDSLMLIARGVVRIDLALENGHRIHMATFARGQFFGEMSFLDHHAHSAEVVAAADCELLILPRPDFDALAARDPAMASHVFASLSIALADRLRHTNDELRAMQAG
jgi:SulP family sulfate permease